MEPKGRVVIVDPAYASSVGHHSDVNQELVGGLVERGWQPECWCDARLSALENNPAWLRGVFSQCGYEDPRHWSDPGGMVHLARRVEEQLQKGFAGLCDPSDQPVTAWVVHSALPFQLLGLARWLRRQPPALVAVSLMFAPGETLEGPAGDEQATALCRLALTGLAQACRAAGHRRWIGVPSAQQGALVAPLLAAAGLPAGDQHPAVVGAGGTRRQPAGEERTVLLHWGDLKRGKGRQEALAVVAALLQHGVPKQLACLGWLFHLHSAEPLPSRERELLERARQQITGFTVLEGPVPRALMLERLAACPLALLAYDPHMYAQRSSGLLWTWASARLAAGNPAAGVGYAQGWLAGEAVALGVGWRGLPAGTVPPEGAEWLKALLVAMADPSSPATFTAYGKSVLGSSFAAHLVTRVLAQDR